MSEKELYTKAINLYHIEGKELEAIEVFKELLKTHPDNLDGWTHLSTLQNKITNFDEAIKSINKAINIDPKNSWTTQQKCTILSLISKLSSEGQMYFNEQTKEAFEITSFNSKADLLLDLDKSIIEVINLERENEKTVYNYSWKLANNKFKLAQYENAIQVLTGLKNQIPDKFNLSRKENEIKKIESAITKNLTGLEKYPVVIERLKNSMSKETDNYFIGMQLADIYTKVNDAKSKENVLKRLLIDNDKRLKEKPELAFLSRKFEILKNLNQFFKIEELVSDFDLIENQNEFIISRKNEIKEKIETYLKNN